MAGKTMLMKTRWYPNPHQLEHSFGIALEAETQNHTIYPFAFYDEGLGTPSALETNPENAAFVESSSPNCFPDSRINIVLAKITFSLTKIALETDKLHAVKAQFMPIHMAFIDDYTAIDELSQLEIQDVLEMTTESTDRQGFPLWSTTDMPQKFTNSSLLSATVPGLTTTQLIESVAFDVNQYYDMLHFMKNGNKLRATSGGLKTFLLTRNRPVQTFFIKLRSKNKFMNPFTFFGCLIGAQIIDTNRQIPINADTSAATHIHVDVSCRYNEWNPDFEFQKISA